MRKRSSLVLLLVPVLMAAKCRHQDHEEIIDVVDVQSTDTTLQVVSVDPSWGPEGEVFKATLYGSAFEQGARVRFGEEIEAARVTFEDANRLKVTVPPLAAQSWDVSVINPDGTMATLRNGLTIRTSTEGLDPYAACDHVVLYFDYDSNRLDAKALADLEKASSCLVSSQGRLRIEGHCDERGTTEYNLALGDRRANAVRAQLVIIGVSPDRLQTLSYGEERPAVPGHDEAAWAQNRRVEIVRVGR